MTTTSKVQFNSLYILTDIWCNGRVF